MWRRRLEGFLSPRPDKDRSSMSLEAWVLPKALMRAVFSAPYLSSSGGDKMMASTSPAVTLSRAATTWLNLVKSIVMGGLRVANWASTWRNHTSGRVVQNGGSLMETDETVAGAGGAAVAGGIRAWRATAMAWTSWASRAITSGSPIVASLASYLQTKEQLTQELR